MESRRLDELCYKLEIDRYIGRCLGFTDISVSAKTADIIGLNRSWQNADIFFTHPDNLRKKVPRSKSRLTMERASVATTKTKASSGSFAMLEATTCRCCVRINSRCTSGSFRSTKTLVGTKAAEVQSMPSSAQINLKKLAWKINCVMLSNIYGGMNMITNAIVTH